MAFKNFIVASLLQLSGSRYIPSAVSILITQELRSKSENIYNSGVRFFILYETSTKILIDH